MTDTPATLEFDVVLQPGGPSGRNLMIEVPGDPKATFGTARAKVTAQLDDHPPFATTLAVMGGKNIFGLSQDRIAELGVAAGQTVHVRLVADSSSREVEVPAELATGLADDDAARATFDGLTASQRKEFCRWVGEAKKQETRDARAATALDRLRAGARSPR